MKKLSDMNYVPSVEEAKLILEESGKLNPGPWIKLTLYVGKAAEQ